MDNHQAVVSIVEGESAVLGFLLRVLMLGPTTLHSQGPAALVFCHHCSFIWGTCNGGVLPPPLLHPNSPSADPILFLAPEGCHPLFLLRLPQCPICHSHNRQDRHPVYWSPLTCDKWRVPLWTSDTCRNWSVEECYGMALASYMIRT